MNLMQAPSTVSLLDNLESVSRERLLGFSQDEMEALRRYFKKIHRGPTLAELEMTAQAWSEHTRHKTLRGRFEIQEARSSAGDPSLTGRASPEALRKGANGKKKIYRNLLQETVFAATQKLKKSWVLSAFEDNAGLVSLDSKWALAIKVETHNHPSALHPYGGASTGIGGVIRDVLGAGLGAQPIANIDVFCVGSWEGPVLEGLAAGVRDYGNRMGIPTVSGLIHVDPVYEGLPLVFAGTLGLIPRNRTRKTGPKFGDFAYLLGGKTGRDGIHGATFSSQELAAEEPAGVVQIGNPILEKRVMDFLLEARDAGLYNSVTDLGAGGIACAIWELAALAPKMGVAASLDRVALKEPAMEGWEILVSESQERMMVSVPPSKRAELEKRLRFFELDFTCLGTFVRGGKVQITYQGQALVDLPISYLKEHPKKSWNLAAVPESPLRRASGDAGPAAGGSPAAAPEKPKASKGSFSAEAHQLGLRLLSSPNIASKEKIVRQYDHEVGGRTVIKPLGGPRGAAPSDAAVIRPLYQSWRGAAIGLGWAGRLALRNPRAAAWAAADEALRNVTAVGGGLLSLSLLDNYCAGRAGDPQVLRELVEVSEALREASLAYGAPFVSGKDSLNNALADGRQVPTAVLITALGVIQDIRAAVSISFSAPGNFIYLVGAPANGFGGSELEALLGFSDEEFTPVNSRSAPKILKAGSRALRAHLAVSCHDLSEGGLFVGLTEMMLGTGWGASVQLPSGENDLLLTLFGEAPTRFLFEVPTRHAKKFERMMKGLPLHRIAAVSPKPELEIHTRAGSVERWHAQELDEAFRGR